MVEVMVQAELGEPRSKDMVVWVSVYGVLKSFKLNPMGYFKEDIHERHF
jgi:hypothetical protein